MFYHLNNVKITCSLLNVYRFSWKHVIRDFCTNSINNSSRVNSSRNLMRAWELHSFGGPKELQLTKTAKIPAIKHPTDIIVNVKASSLNPLDLLMSSGYGARALSIMRRLHTTPFPDLQDLQKHVIDFPITLGRDFSGIVHEIGADVKDLKIGDEVYGALGVQRNGSHADYVVASSDVVRKKPSKLKHTEAASIPYVGLTAYSAIHLTGSYSHNLDQKKFLVIGGSGGIGTFAIQYLRACGAFVVTTCTAEAFSLVSELGCHYAIDYNDKDYIHHIKKHAPYNCILDASGSAGRPELLEYLYNVTGQYITLSQPFVKNIDMYGLGVGLAKNLSTVTMENILALTNNKVPVKWAFFIPINKGFDAIHSHLEQGKIKAVIQQVFPFEDMHLAFEKLEVGPTRGKIVIDYEMEKQ